MTTTPIPAGQAYKLDKDAGVTDLWWPFGPVTGRYTMKVTGDQTEGRLLQFVASDSRGAATPLHTHRDTDETFYVISGELTVFVGDERLELSAGDFAFGPMGVPHAFAVTSEHAEYMITYSPAGTRGPEGYGVQGFFKEVAPAVVDADDPAAPTAPDPELFARRMDAYGIDMVGPPPAL
jgi:quercetin dioxygenase-like cupin family protein